MSGFKCPFCGQVMSIQTATLTQHRMNFESDSFGYLHDKPHLLIEVYKCPSCRSETVGARGLNGYCNDRRVLIHPTSLNAVLPDYVPKAIRDDFAEAHSILDLSPKSAATLARRCLQGMIHDFWGIHEKNLNAEITALKDKVSPAQWGAIDSLKKLGNIGAHMEKDVNVIVDIEPAEASALLRLIELLVDKWYTAREDEKKLYESISAIGAAKEAERKSSLVDSDGE